MKRRSIITLIFLSFILFSQGQSFGELHTITSGRMDSYAESIHTADIDNDGDMDIISSTQRGIYLLENKGDNKFEIIRELFQTEQGGVEDINRITTADVNNDGLLDIVFSRTYYWDQLMWLENTGDNTFKEGGKIFSFTGAGWRSLSYSLCELNGDGLVDVVIACNENDLGIEILINNGDATFDHKQSLLQEGTVIFYQCIDMDNDDDIDILYKTTYPYKIAIFVNNGTGDFTEEVMVSNDLSNILKPAYAFDSDGDNDIDIFGLSSQDSIVLLLNSGDLLYDQTIVINDTNFKVRGISAFDFDKDGDNDLINLHQQILQNRGNNSFKSFEIGVPPTYSRTYEIKDINNNNKEDYIFEGKRGAICIVEDIDTTNHNNWITLTSQIFSLSYPDYKKINDDEYPDICVLDYYYKYVFLLNNGKGEFTDTITAPMLHRQNDGTAFDDFNGDGFCDIVSYSDYEGQNTYDSCNFVFAKNNGDNTFSPICNTDFNHIKNRYPVYKDYNGDNLLDIILLEYGFGYESDTILLFNANQDFTVSLYGIISLPIPIDIYKIEFHDLDLNGHKDLIINTGYSLLVSFCENGDYENELASIINSTDYISDFSFARFGTDSIYDLVYSTAEYINVLENLEGNYYEQSYSMHITGNAYRIYTADINSDSIDEIFYIDNDMIGIMSSISNQSYDFNYHYYKNKASSMAYYTAYNTFIFADIDLDNDLDLLCTDSRNSDVSWLENDFSPDFIEETFLTQELTIYPNPVNDNLNVVINKTLNTDCELLVFNNLGEEIQHYSVQPKQNMLNINASQLPSGVYYILLKTNNKHQKGQVFIKQ